MASLTRTIRPARDAGFVLLATLVLLVLAATILVGVSRRSARRAADVVAARDNLQSRWGAESLRGAMADSAERLLAEHTDLQARGGRQMTAVIRLGEQEFHIVLADEQSKVSLNSLSVLGGMRSVEAFAQKQVLVAGANLAVSLTPDPVALAAASDLIGGMQGTGKKEKGNVLASNGEGLFADERHRPFRSWGQVFGPCDPETLLGWETSNDPRAIDAMTCWGDGRLDVRHATKDAILAVTKGWLSGEQVGKLFEARQKNPSGALDSWLEPLQLNKEKRDKTALFLTDTSYCWSLTIQVEDRRRRSFEVTVAERINDNKDRRGANVPSLTLYTFRW